MMNTIKRVFFYGSLLSIKELNLARCGARTFFGLIGNILPKWGKPTFILITRKWRVLRFGSTAWDYVGLLCNLYRDAVPKHWHFSQTSRAQFPVNFFYTWCNFLLTGLHHSPVVNIPFLLPWSSSILPLHLPPLSLLACTRVKGNNNRRIQWADLTNLISDINIYFYTIDHSGGRLNFNLGSDPLD